MRRCGPMPPPLHCNVNELADIFQESQAEIIAEWRLHAGRLLRDLDLDQPTLTDQLPDVIVEIIRELSLHRDGDLSMEHIRGSPPVHGVQRFHDDTDVGEVVAEYNLL